jgi:hypothetical protein
LGRGFTGGKRRGGERPDDWMEAPSATGTIVSETVSPQPAATKVGPTIGWSLRARARSYRRLGRLYGAATQVGSRSHRCEATRPREGRANWIEFRSARGRAPVRPCRPRRLPRLELHSHRGEARRGGVRRPGDSQFSRVRPQAAVRFARAHGPASYRMIGQVERHDQAARVASQLVGPVAARFRRFRRQKEAPCAPQSMTIGV